MAIPEPTTDRLLKKVKSGFGSIYIVLKIDVPGDSYAKAYV